MKRTLLTLHTGQRGIVAGFSALDKQVLAKLSALGIIPGAALLLHKKRPMVLVSTGHTLVALDHTIAEKIMITSRR